MLTDPLGIRLPIQLKHSQRDRVPGGFLSVIVFKFQKLVVSQVLKIHMQRSWNRHAHVQKVSMLRSR